MTTQTTQTTSDTHRPTWFRRGATVAATVGCALALSFGIATSASAAPISGQHVSTHRVAAGSSASVDGTTVTAVSPAVQAGEASQVVDITGSGFTGATRVAFGDVSAYGMKVISDTEISAVAPAHANGVVDLVITTPHGTATLPQGYTYTDPTSQSFEQDVNVPGFSGAIAAVECPAATPYLTNAGTDEVIGFTDEGLVSGVTEWENPHYSTTTDGQARGVVVHYGNANIADHTVMPTVHCTNSASAGFSTKLTPGQPIAGPAAPNPSSRANGMDQLLPFVINNSNSYLKITKVWRSGTFDDDPNFIDGAAPEAGQVIAPNSQGAVNLRFTTGGQTLHVRFTDDHGDVFETSVSGSSFTSGFQAQWTCSNTAGSNLQCHPTTQHMIDSTLVQIENS